MCHSLPFLSVMAFDLIGHMAYLEYHIVLIFFFQIFRYICLKDILKNLAKHT